MANRSFQCPHCSSTIRYTETQAGTSAKCPRCGEPVTVPLVYDDPADDVIVLGGDDDDERPIRLAEEPKGNYCSRCGKKVEHGNSRCMRCRQEVIAELSARIKSDTAMENSIAYQANQAAIRRENRMPQFPHMLHILLLVVSFGTWIPFYIWWYRSWTEEKEEKRIKR